VGIHKWGNYREMDQESRYEINKIGGWGNIGELRDGEIVKYINAGITDMK
jgi:hypothetical protein